MSKETPCIAICIIDPKTKLCLGCGRTLPEIGGWGRMESAERLGIMAQLDARMAAAGLGLPIAKSLIDLHGGTFTLKSKVRIGTEVIVTFPPERVMAALAPMAAPPLQPEMPNADDKSLRKRSIFRLRS